MVTNLYLCSVFDMYSSDKCFLNIFFMTISVIIPVYKVEKYIQRCLKSVVAQECDDFDIECILVDDCTPDKSMDIAKDFIDHYSGSISFLFFYNSENQGLSVSRNNGLMMAKGDYVFFLDSDDDITANCLSNLSKRINQNGRVVDMVIGNSYDYHTNHYWLNREGSPILLLNHIEIMRRFLQVEIPMMAWNKLVRRQLLIDNHLLFRPRMIHEDELWSYELFGVIGSVVLIPEITYIYEQNEESIMTSSSNLICRVEGCQILVSKMLDSLCRELYVERFFWGINMYMKSEAHIRTGRLMGEIVLNNRQLCRLMIERSLRDLRLTIFVFLLLTIQSPFCKLIRYRWFRQKYYWIRKLFYKFAIVFDFIHRE